MLLLCAPELGRGPPPDMGRWAGSDGSGDAAAGGVALVLVMDLGSTS